MTIDKETGYSPSCKMRDLIKDNSLLLPAISRFDIAFGFGDNTIRQVCLESHDDTVAKLNELKDIFIYHYKKRDNAKLSGALLDIIICERDLISHFEVENKLFIPLLKKLKT